MEQAPIAAGPLEASVRARRPKYCPCHEERPDPCPACGATVSGKDAVHGVCQATHGMPPSDYGLRLILVDKETGAPVGA